MIFQEYENVQRFRSTYAHKIVRNVLIIYSIGQRAYLVIENLSIL